MAENRVSSNEVAVREKFYKEILKRAQLRWISFDCSLHITYVSIFAYSHDFAHGPVWIFFICGETFFSAFRILFFLLFRSIYYFLPLHLRSPPFGKYLFLWFLPPGWDIIFLRERPFWGFVTAGRGALRRGFYLGSSGFWVLLTLPFRLFTPDLDEVNPLSVRERWSQKIFFFR